MRVTMLLDVTLADGADAEAVSDALSIALETATSTPGLLQDVGCKNVGPVYTASLAQSAWLLRQQPEVVAIKVVTFGDVLWTCDAEDTPENREVVRNSYEAKHFAEMRDYDWEFWGGVEGLTRSGEHD
jgi:hypothetical protein